MRETVEKLVGRCVEHRLVTVGIEDLVFNSSQDSLIYCAESRHLLEGFGDKVHELMLLHEQQFQAITSGDPDCDRFDILIHMANEAKQRSKYAYLQHLENHGCDKE